MFFQADPGRYYSDWLNNNQTNEYMLQKKINPSPEYYEGSLRSIRPNKDVTNNLKKI